MSTQSQSPKINFLLIPSHPTHPQKIYTHPYPTKVYHFNKRMKISKNLFQLHSLSSHINQRQESLHLEPILRLIATLTQDHCSPWKSAIYLHQKVIPRLIENLKYKLLSQSLTHLG